ncbi:MAG: CDP-glycerol glycerophosphotransferase family protein [Erysipelotrichaceae bacterium]
MEENDTLNKIKTERKTERYHEDGFALSFKQGDVFYLKGKHNNLRCICKDGFFSIREIVKENFHKIDKQERYQLMRIIQGEDECVKQIELPFENEQLICIHHIFIKWHVEQVQEGVFVYLEELDQSNDLIIDDFDFKDNLLTLSILVPDAWEYDYDTYLMLYHNEKLRTFKENEQSKNHLKMFIDLNHFENLDANLYGLALYSHSNIYRFQSAVGFSINSILTKGNDLYKLLHLEIGENATVQICENDWHVEPQITAVAHENHTLILNGYLKHDLDLFHYPNVSFNAMLNSNDDQKNIPIDIKMNGYSFTMYFEDELICHLNKEYFDRWNMSFNIICNDEVAGSFPFVKGSALSGSILFTKEWMDENFKVSVELCTSKVINQLYFSFRQPYAIQRINYVEIKANQIKIHVKMNTNIETFYKGMRIVLGPLGKASPCLIKKRGPRTLLLTYKGEHQSEISEMIHESKCPFIIEGKDCDYRNDIWDFDRSRIYSSFSQHVFNSKRYRRLCRLLYRKVFLRLPIRRKKILFESFLGRNVSGNPKYLYKYMNDNGYGNAYKMYWILNDTDEEVEGCAHKIQRRSVAYYYHMATAGYWMFNTRQDSDIVKREKTTYLQTWHGTPLKRLGMDMDSVSMATVSNIVDYKKEFVNNSRRWDYLLAQNQYSADIFRRCFAFRNELLCDGYPANDILFNSTSSDIEALKDKFNLPKDKRIVLYAPTWRDDNFLKKGYYQMKMQLDLDMMRETLGKDTIVLLRMHYLIMNAIDIEAFEGFAYDFSNNCDIQELYLVSDLLITDYSSTMFDFANLKRPIIFFTYDIEEYRDSLRGFYFDFEKEAPGPIVKTTKEVIHAIQNIDAIQDEYKEKAQMFYKKFNGIDDGHAAHRVLDKILAKKASNL